MLTAPDSNSSEPSSSARPAIAKWPFILGDIVLVLVALAMSSTAGTLSEMQMLFCLGAVGLGGILLATPFALEAFPPATWQIFSGHSRSRASTPDGLTEGELRRQARAAAEAVEHAARANAALETSARRFDARFAPLVEVQKSLEAVAAELREAATVRQSVAGNEAQAVQREFDRLRKEQAEKFKTAEAKIIALEETLGVIVSHLKTIAARPASTAIAADAPAPTASARKPAKPPAPVAVEMPAAVPVEEPALVAVGATVAVAESPSLGSISAAETSLAEHIAPAPHTEPPIEKAPEEPSMLAKALATVQPAAESSAVSDIIQSRSRRSRKSKPHFALDALSTPVEVQSLDAAILDQFFSVTADPFNVETPVAAAVEPPAAPAPEKAIAPPAEESASELRRSARAKAIALRGDDEDDKAMPTIFTPPSTEEPATPSTEPSQGELLAREADTIRRKRATKSPHSFATLTARVLIGIGNKPFVRGEGPGLSADKGVPMEFVEIGQWRWVAPKDASGPITLRILKNDEVPAEGDPIVLKPGQTLDVSPVFPG